MKFYNVKTRETVDVPDSDVELVTMKNGKKAAKAVYNGVKLFKILGKQDLDNLKK